MTLREHLAGLPSELADALEQQYRNVMEHFLLEEWDEAQVDAGRLAEAILRVLQWHMKGRYTPLDGKSKPNRKVVVNQAEQDTSLEPSLRQQVPQAAEMIMDFRNNRNAAHLGGVDPNKLDAMCVVQLASWAIGEIVRLETKKAAGEVQRILDGLAERHVPAIEMVGDRPVVTDITLTAPEKAVLLLYHHNDAVPIRVLQDWAEYGHATRWRDQVIAGLRKAKLVHVEDSEVVLLTKGKVEAERILARQAKH